MCSYNLFLKYIGYSRNVNQKAETQKTMGGIYAICFCGQEFRDPTREASIPILVGNEFMPITVRLIRELNYFYDLELLGI